MDPLLAVCWIGGTGMTPAAAQEIYRVALEQARAVIRPTLGQRICMN